MSATAQPQVRETRLATSGSWTAVTRPLTLALDGASGVINIGYPFCTAETGSAETAILRIVFGLQGVLYLQIGSEQWNFRRGHGNVNLRSAAGQTLSLPSARHAEAFMEIGFDPPRAAAALASLQTMAQTGGSHIDVLDRRNRVLARFPTHGMRDMLERARRCAQPYH